MITQLKNGKIIITLETEREVQLVKSALGSVTRDGVNKELQDNNLPILSPMEIDPSVILYYRLEQIG